jgi:hypothetical protein
LALSVLLSTFLHLERAGKEKFQESRSFSQPVSPRSRTILSTFPARIGSQRECPRPARFFVKKDGGLPAVKHEFSASNTVEAILQWILVNISVR